MALPSLNSLGIFNCAQAKPVYFGHNTQPPFEIYPLFSLQQHIMLCPYIFSSSLNSPGSASELVVVVLVGTFGNIWRHIQLSKLGRRGMLLASTG